MEKNLTRIESKDILFDYDLLLTADTNSGSYILYKDASNIQWLTIVKKEKQNWQLLTDVWISRRINEIEIKSFTMDSMEFVVLDYINDNRVVLMYKDIIFRSDYYWVDVIDWAEHNAAFIKNHFTIMIGDKVDEAIDSINIDSESILAIVDKYALPNSRDLMLVKAIEKYSDEMGTLLESIHNKDTKTLFQGAIDWLEKLFTNK